MTKQEVQRRLDMVFQAHDAGILSRVDAMDEVTSIWIEYFRDAKLPTLQEFKDKWTHESK